MDDLTLYVVVWAEFALATAWLANTKGLDTGRWFSIGLVLGIIGLLWCATQKPESAWQQPPARSEPPSRRPRWPE